MKRVESKSYVTAQMTQIKFDGARLRDGPPNPQVRIFQQSFVSLGLESIAFLTEADAMALSEIQDKIRKKLRSFGVQTGF